MRVCRQRSFARYTAAATLAAMLGLAGCGQESAPAGPPAAPPPPPVTLAVVEAEDVQLYGDYPGRVRGAREVQVRAQVGGILEARLFEEGRAVEQGQALFRIEPAPYRIALARAEADLADARAGLNQAEREWRRVSGLFEQKVASARERDAALSQLELARARLALNEAGVAQAKLNLDYTEVRAPLAGVTGLENVPEGSLVERGTLLATVTRHDPVHVLFSLPHGDVAAQRIARDALAGTPGAHRFEATLLLPDGSAYARTGHVDFADSTVDPRTGTISVRAVFPNPERAVVPGQFLRVRVATGRFEDVFRIDAGAVVQGAHGPSVFVVEDGDVARARPVKLGPVVDGRQLVLEGLASGERVIVNGQVAVRDGLRVAPRSANGGGA